MRTFPLCACAALGLALAAGSTHAQQYVAEPSLLPQPAPINRYQVQPVGFRGGYQPQAETLPSPSDRPPAPPVEAPPPMESEPPSSYEHAMQSEWGDGAVCQDGSCGCGPVPHWYGYAGALFINKNHRHGFVTSYDQGTGAPVLDNCMTAPDLMGGFEVSLGRTIGSCYALEATYWGLYPGAQTATAYGAGDIGTVINFGTGMEYDDGLGTVAPIGDWFQNGFIHQLRTFTEIHSVEVNLLGSAWGGGFGGCGGMGDVGNCGAGGCGHNPCSRWGGGWLAGIRYFQFDETFLLSADDLDDTFDGDANEVHYDVRMKNRLVGFQFGGGLTYRLGCRWTLYGLGKAGVYANNIDHFQCVYGSNGTAVITTGAYAGQELKASSQTTDLAMLAQFDLGARWQMNCNWALKFGYRVVGVSGVGLVEHQIPNDFNNYADVLDIDSNGSLLLHGGYAGLEFCF